MLGEREAVALEPLGGRRLAYVQTFLGHGRILP
jgi:hypothetical protein